MWWSLLLYSGGAAWGCVPPFFCGAVWPPRSLGGVAFPRSPWVVLLSRTPDFRVELLGLHRLWVVLVRVFCVNGVEEGEGSGGVGWLVD